jgi:hypothetical protein
MRRSDSENTIPMDGDNLTLHKHNVGNEGAKPRITQNHAVTPGNPIVIGEFGQLC